MADLKTIAQLRLMEIGDTKQESQYEITRVYGGWLYCYVYWEFYYDNNGSQQQRPLIGGPVFVPDHQCCTCKKGEQP